MIAENEFFKIIEAKSAKLITIISSARIVEDQIARPSKLTFVTSAIAVTNGKKIKNPAVKNPAMYPKINFSRDIAFDKMNSTSLFSKARLVVRQTNKIMPIIKIARDDPAI